MFTSALRNSSTTVFSIFALQRIIQIRLVTINGKPRSWSRLSKNEGNHEMRSRRSRLGPVVDFRVSSSKDEPFFRRQRKHNSERLRDTISSADELKFTGKGRKISKAHYWVGQVSNQVQPTTFGGAPRSAVEVSEGARRHRPDYAVLILTALLMVIGLIVVYSISPGLAASQHVSQGYFVTKQLIDVALGAMAFAVAAILPLRRWSELARPLAIAAIVGSLVVMVTPINEVYPAHRWIRLGGFSFQVAELIKLVLVIGLARFMTIQWRKGKIADFGATLKPLIILLLAIGVVVAKLQSDLGSAGVMIAIMAVMAFMVGVPLKKVAIIFGIILAVLVIAVSSSGYRRERLNTFLHPGSDCKGSAYQACQALIAVGSGGVFGKGLGYGAASYGYLPEASNDSIYAIMAEKFGFIGTTAIIVIYGVFIARLKKLIERTADQFSRLVLVGVLSWLSTQMIINIGAMLGLLPLKGITLPLISQGGTSLVFLTAALGLAFQISRYTSYNATEPKTGPREPADNNINGRRIRRTYNPAYVSRPRT